MEHCEGVKDWLHCLKCTYLCSSRCPLEGTDVVESLARRLRGAEEEKDCSRT